MKTCLLILLLTVFTINSKAQEVPYASLRGASGTEISLANTKAFKLYLYNCKDCKIVSFTIDIPLPAGMNSITVSGSSPTAEAQRQINRLKRGQTFTISGIKVALSDGDIRSVIDQEYKIK